MEKQSEAAFPAPPWRKPRKSGGAKQPLSQELIVVTALKILDAEGMDGLSMRRVAQELDTGPASLYAHVANKEELLDLLLDRVCEEIVLPEPDPAHWREQIKQVAHEIHRVLSAHSDIARVPLGNIPTGPNSLRVNEALLAIMIGGGVPRRIAAIGVERLFLYINADAYEGSIHISKQRASGLSPEEYMGRFIGQVREFFSGLPADRFPVTVSLVEDMTAGDPDGEDRFELGLEMIIRGLESYITA